MWDKERGKEEQILSGVITLVGVMGAIGRNWRSVSTGKRGEEKSDCGLTSSSWVLESGDVV